MDLTELLAAARERGFTRGFDCADGRLQCPDSGESFAAEDASIIEADAIDAGTDPGDDATLYLIETTSGRRGFLVVADSFHSDPDKTAFLNRLLALHGAK